MTGKLSIMHELIKDLKIGQELPFRDLKAKIDAFSDEHVFLSIPEIAVSPEEFEGVAEAKRVKDRQVENLRAEIYRLQEENQRLLHDPRYREEAMYRENRREAMRRDSYRMMDQAFYNLRPRHHLDPGILRMDEIPRKDYYIDPLSFKTPTQKK